MSSSQCESCITQTEVLAVILDLDENATKYVLKEFLAKYGKDLDKERESKKRFGMTLQVSAALIVKDYDLPLTPNQFIEEIMPMYRDKWLNARALPGANRLIKHLYKNGLPFALASNSLTEYIDAKISHQEGWKECFSTILGSDQVKSGKPSPDLFIEAARRMGVDAAKCLVIEDSLVGVQAAKAAKMKVVVVPSQSEGDCSLLADSMLHSLLEFRPELWGLPPFDDWFDNALPIEPIYLSIQYKNGFVSNIRDVGKSALPCQVSGLFFGWAESGIHGTLKVLVHIGSDHCSCSPHRKIQICIIDKKADELPDQQMQLVLVGYIRGMYSMEIGSIDVGILEEDKSIASSCLDQHHFAVPSSWQMLHI
ncbi:bifunctional riboflavin kinase/FMN phosphatase isoform X2 [Ricinus communis]|uniref:bifunctional riboflavin kinase/FMN phosphatase isoform X2 n=1 Tax=Ricinus communis TaxID=3988 RepID=UPI00201A2F59|nr:bifunctional riboflavin kinase/FMN phosphatase isoform X2 [Ricinus communis]